MLRLFQPEQIRVAGNEARGAALALHGPGKKHAACLMPVLLSLNKRSEIHVQITELSAQLMTQAQPKGGFEICLNGKDATRMICQSYKKD